MPEQRLPDERAPVVGPLLRLFSSPPDRALLSFDQVHRLLRSRTAIHRGTRRIPLDHIVGSLGRYRDFTRAFLPLNDAVRERRKELEAAAREAPLPPIEVYEVGGVYFVRDGNHRVSLARAQGRTTIEAVVSEVKARVALTPDVDVGDLILKEEEADFLDATRLPRTSGILLTEPGRYQLLREHVEVHRYYLCLQQERDVPVDEAAASWHENVYLPVVEAIRDTQVLRQFPKRTEADLYLWVAYHRERLKEDLGDMPGDHAVASAIGEQYSDRPVAGFVRSVARAIRAAVRAARQTPDVFAGARQDSAPLDVTPAMVRGLNHVTFAVSDVPRSVDFYEKVLGLRPVARWPEGAYFRAGDLWFVVLRDAQVRSGPLPEYTHLAFSVNAADVPVLRDRLVAAGATFWQDNATEGESLYFTDPDGHKLELHVGDLSTRLARARAHPWEGLEILEPGT